MADIAFINCLLGIMDTALVGSIPEVSLRSHNTKWKGFVVNLTISMIRPQSKGL